MLFLAGKCRTGGFTFLEIMIVVMVIGILASIAVPNFLIARDKGQTKVCAKNLRQIADAKEQHALTANIPSGAPVGWDDIVPDYIETIPKCPAGGEYTIGPVGTEPDCSSEGHGP